MGNIGKAVKKSRMRLDWTDRTIRGVTYALVSVFAVACIIPFWLILASSFASESSIRRTGFALWPSEISFRSYNLILQSPDLLIGSYIVTICMTIIGTLIGLFIVSMTGYALQRKDFQLRNKISFFIYFTSLFTAGLVPFYYIIVKIYGLKDNYLAVLLPLLMNPWLIILMKNFVKAIPHEITESWENRRRRRLHHFLQADYTVHDSGACDHRAVHRLGILERVVLFLIVPDDDREIPAAAIPSVQHRQYRRVA